MNKEQLLGFQSNQSGLISKIESITSLSFHSKHCAPAQAKPFTMKKQSLLLLLLVAFGSLVCAQTTVPAPAKPTLQQKLNTNTDPKNQQAPTSAPAPAPASKNTKPSPGAGKTSGNQGGTGTLSSQKKDQPAAVSTPCSLSRPCPACTCCKR